MRHQSITADTPFGQIENILLPHRRQYIIGPRPYKIYPNWMQAEISPEFHISHCPQLRLNTVQDKDGCRWWLMGSALPSLSTEKTALNEIAAASTVDIPRLAEAWAGQWLLLNEQEIYPDSGAMLACFYCEITGAGKNRALWLSSSLRLLADMDRDVIPKLHNLVHTRSLGIDFDPPPLTRWQGVRRLLPSQIFMLKKRRAISRRPDLFTSPSPMGMDTALDEAAERLKVIAVHASALPLPSGTTQIALTAGFDSRLLVSAFLAAQCPFETYTFKNPPVNSPADIALPPKISAAANVQHRFFGPNQPDSRTQERLHRHVHGDYDGTELYSIPKHLYSSFSHQDILVRGAGLVHTNCFYNWALPPGFDPQSGSAATDFLFRMGHRQSPELQKMIAATFDWIMQTPMDGLDFEARFTWEARLGAWASTTEHAIAMTPAATVLPLNCTTLARLLFTVPAAQRQEKVHMKKLIQRLAPEMLSLPFNPRPSLWQKCTRRAEKFSTILQRQGIMASIKWAAKAAVRS